MSRLTLAGLFLALSLPAAAKEKAAKKAPEKAAETTSIKLPDMAERQKVFGEVDAAIREGRKAKAADLLVEITTNGEVASFHAEAWGRLGLVLQELDLPYAALIANERALTINAPLMSDSAKVALKLGDKVGDTALLEKVFAANVGLPVDEATSSRMAYLAAREAVHQGNFAVAQAILKMVKASDPFYPEAKTLEGITYALQDRHKDALAPLLTARAAGESAKRKQAFFDNVDMNLARAYYASENFPRAIEYYAKVDRASRDWPQAQFERAWASFRMDDMNLALSQLATHTSPFFDEWFFPEAWLLRIHSLFMMCKFPEASKQVLVFQEHFAPMQKELVAVSGRSPEDLFNAMARQVETGKSDLPRMITWPFEAEDRFLSSLKAVRAAEDESKRLDNIAANPFSRAAKDWVGARRNTLIQEEGKRIAARAAGMNEQLNQMLNDAELSKLDMMDMEKRLYEQAAITGKMDGARNTVLRKDRVKPGYQAWPWEGEYWADEVGYIRIEAKPDCPAGMRNKP